MQIKIKRWWDGKILFEGDFPSMRDAVVQAVATHANLTGAILTVANLRDALLTGAILTHANLTRADLTDANLRDALLTGAILTGADLTRAHLTRADLTGAILRGANLRDALLTGAILTGANLTGAILTGANLTGANLRDALLTGADLAHANLTDANLTRADLTGAILRGAILTADELQRLVDERTILPQEGDVIGFKKLFDDSIVKLLIPASAKRFGGLIGRKCRAEFAVVISGHGEARYDHSFKYEEGQTVRPRLPFDPDPRVECGAGIHFFITRSEAERY